MRELAIEQNVVPHHDEEERTMDFTYIFNTYYKRIYNFQYYRTHNQVVAEDLCSMTFEKAFINFKKYNKEKANFEVWLFTIARNVSNDYFRHQKRHPWDSLEQVFEKIANESTLEAQIIHNEEKESLLQAVRRLKDKERALIAYKYGAGLKNKEIAALVGMKEKTVGTSLCRILKKMRSELQEASYEK